MLPHRQLFIPPAQLALSYYSERALPLKHFYMIIHEFYKMPPGQLVLAPV